MKFMNPPSSHLPHHFSSLPRSFSVARTCKLSFALISQKNWGGESFSTEGSFRASQGILHTEVEYSSEYLVNYLMWFHTRNVVKILWNILWAILLDIKWETLWGTLSVSCLIRYPVRFQVRNLVRHLVGSLMDNPLKYKTRSFMKHPTFCHIGFLVLYKS